VRTASWPWGWQDRRLQGRRGVLLYRESCKVRALAIGCPRNSTGPLWLQHRRNCCRFIPASTTKSGPSWPRRLRVIPSDPRASV